MKVFVAMKVPRGLPELELLADRVADLVSQAGHQPLVATREIARLGLTAPTAFMPYVRQQVETCGLMIVLYHPELRGGLIELGLAYARHQPIWLCSQRGVHVSSSASGCADLRIEYSHLSELEEQLSTHLNEFHPPKPTR